MGFKSEDNLASNFDAATVDSVKDGINLSIVRVGLKKVFRNEPPCAKFASSMSGCPAGLAVPVSYVCG